jgi:hypothetical protein
MVSCQHFSQPTTLTNKFKGQGFTLTPIYNGKTGNLNWQRAYKARSN